MSVGVLRTRIRRARDDLLTSGRSVDRLSGEAPRWGRWPIRKVVARTCLQDTRDLRQRSKAYAPESPGFEARHERLRDAYSPRQLPLRHSEPQSARPEARPDHGESQRHRVVIRITRPGTHAATVPRGSYRAIMLKSSRRPNPGASRGVRYIPCALVSWSTGVRSTPTVIGMEECPGAVSGHTKRRDGGPGRRVRATAVSGSRRPAGPPPWSAGPQARAGSRPRRRHDGGRRRRAAPPPPAAAARRSR